MYIVEMRFKLKPDVEIADLLSLFNEEFRKHPSCISANIIEYKTYDGSKPEWDYAYVGVWESEEADIAAHDSDWGRNNSQVNEKFQAMTAEMSVAFATVIASGK
ncbi:hypothetical protein ACFL6S_11640 [Candidatus Poribacteria bacterium]